MTPPSVAEQILAFRRICFDHAADLLVSARLLHQQGMPHIAYHLAALSLEEIGKCRLVSIAALTHPEEPLRPDAHGLSDHVHKLWWALWSDSIGREVITGRQIETARDLARRVDERRKQALYVTPTLTDIRCPREFVSEEEASQLIALATSLLAVEQATTIRTAIPPEERGVVDWFLRASEDADLQRLVFGPASMRRMAESGSALAWMSWLKEQCDQAEAEGQLLAKRELARQRPTGESALKDKWRIRVRLHSFSTSIRPGPLRRWNDGVKWIKLHPVHRNKTCIDIDFILAASVPVDGVWPLGLRLTAAFLAAINIGTRALFWWHPSRHTSKFYDSLTDIETSTEVVLSRTPELSIAWGQAALTDVALHNVQTVLGPILSVGDIQPLQKYVNAATLLASTSVYFRAEAHAFWAFFEALSDGMDHFNRRPADMTFPDAFRRFAQESVPTWGDSDRFIELYESRRTSSFERPPVITLEEVGVIKVLTDAFLYREFAAMLPVATTEDAP